MARTKPAPAAHAADSAAHGAAPPAQAPVAWPVPGSPAATVLAALAASPGGATTADIAAHAQISPAAARQTLTRLEKAGTVTRTRAARPGVPALWEPAAAPDTAAAEPASTPAAGTGSQPGTAAQQQAGPPDTPDPAKAADRTPETGHNSADADGDAGEKAAVAGPDPTVTDEAAGCVLVIGQAAEAARQALGAGNLAAALAAMDEAHQQAAQGRRVLRAAAAGKRSPATRPGGLRELIEQHLRGYPDKQFTPHQIGKALGRSSGAVANALDKLVSLDVAELATEKPRSYRLAPTALAPASGGCRVRVPVNNSAPIEH